MEEDKRLRNSEKRLREQNGNLLDATAKRDAYFTRHQEAEQDARTEANRAQSTIGLLKEQAALDQEQMRAIAKQLEQLQRGAVPSGTHCDALDAVKREIEELRNLLQVERDEKEEMRTKLEKGEG
jgi:hypothetical protein